MPDAGHLADVDTERTVLGACLIASRPILSSIVAEVRPADMWRGAHGDRLAAIVDLHLAGEKPDVLAVVEHLERRGLGDGALAELTGCVANVPAAALGVRAARRVAQLARRRRVAEAAGALTAAAHDLTVDVDTASADCVDTLAATHAGDVTQSSGDLVDGALAAMERGDEMLGWAAPWRPLEKLWRIVPGWVHVVTGFRSAGKALALDTPLPTPTGWTTMGDVRPGDMLLDEQGRPCRVVAATEMMVGRPCYEVRFIDGTSVIADAEHLWLTHDAAARHSENRAARRGPLKRRGTDQRHKRAMPAVRTTDQIAQSLRTHGNESNHSIPTTQPLSLPEADLPIDPYVLGVWLGDGDAAGARITYAAADREIANHLSRAGVTVIESQKDDVITATIGSPRARGVCGRGHRIELGAKCRECNRITSATRRAGQPPADRPFRSLAERLREAGLLGNKHIPDVYLRASAAQREALLQGLIDTDGHVDKQGRCEFTSTNAALAGGVAELVVSLGWRANVTTGRATIDGRYCGPKYRVHFTPDRPVCRLARKVARQSLQRHAKAAHRTIVGCTPVPSVPVRCIEVDSPSSLFLCTRSMIPTHNSAVTDALVAGLAMIDDVHTLIWSPEGAPSAEHLLRIAQVHVGSDLSVRSPADAVTPLQWVTERVGWIDHESQTTLAQILAAADATRTRRRVDLLLIDPFTSVDKFDTSSDEPWDRMLNRNLTRLQAWARSRGVAVIVVAHPKQRDRLATGVRPVATDADIHGGIMWGNQADCLISVWRDETGVTRSPSLVDIHIQKVRHDGPGGRMGRMETLRRDDHGRYYPVISAVPGVV